VDLCIDDIAVYTTSGADMLAAGEMQPHVSAYGCKDGKSGVSVCMSVTTTHCLKRQNKQQTNRLP